jgi:sigma-B regulation protein RsbU (phosphoserine phosphatase)
MRPGDVLVIYSDGVTEARDDRDEEFGESRVTDVVTSGSEDPAESILLKLIETVKAYAGQAAPADDITVVVVKRCE